MVSKWLGTSGPLPALSKTTLVALVINALAYASEFNLIGKLDREVGIVVALLVIAGALVATGWRWAPALAALLAGAILIGNPFLLYNLSLPVTDGFFRAALVEAISGLVIVVAGIAATVQSYWKRG